MRIGILALALVAAGLAAFLARSLVSDEKPQVVVPQIIEQPMAEVLVAASDLALGQRVSKGDLVWQPWPEDAVTNSYITQDVQPNAFDVFGGAIARSPILAGEPITNGKLVSFENAGFMSALISPGMRAVSTKISPETGAGGFILPNDRVDVIMTMRLRSGSTEEDGGNNGYRSETILRNVRVLAIDQTFKEVEGEQVVVGKTATLEMLPAQAEGFALAAAQGEISLALRSLADTGRNDQVPTNVSAEQTSGGTLQRGASVRVLRYGAETTVSTIAGRGK
ncbi:Flp pilus assembly protein CpaB [Parvibaculaceae bacterium PLY_AMNH_Bact1]|nr:Flp pilus assembly protein CpaB [Parvibaculaceae bacterium PLY_AMNH_Bact1]